MTSTYLPFFFPLVDPAGPLRACGSPRRSSIEVALLNDVPGREGGPPGGARNERGKLEASEGALVEMAAGGALPLGPGGLPMGTGKVALGVEFNGGIGLTVLVGGGAGPLGGGGVPTVAVLLPGSFLFTHFFKSWS